MEVAARINGIKAGQYHYAFNLPADLYHSLVKDPKIRIVKLEPTYWCGLNFNTKQGLCATRPSTSNPGGSEYGRNISRRFWRSGRSSGIDIPEKHALVYKRRVE